LERFPRRMKQVANLPRMALPRRDLDALFGFGDCWQAEMFPSALL
jgi:hypothetical protein